MQRFSLNTAIDLFLHGPTSYLQDIATAYKNTIHRHRYITYVRDTNPNYTNICTSYCRFCAFCRSATAPDSFFLEPHQIRDILQNARNQGATTVLLQGGMNPKVTLQYLVDVTKIACSEFPDLHPHFFSAPEIWHAALHSNVSIQTALQQLWDAGLRTIPGGGAEVLSERLYQQLSPLKISPKNWLLLHELAHRIGFRTTATMMFGHFETPEEIVAHLDALRTLQDKTGGFSSFIPWSFKRTNTPLSKTVTSQASPLMYLRLIALSRIYLDNFEHIGASWFGEGKQTGMNALNFGADDFGGTLFEESVHKATGYSNVTSEQEVLWMIRHSGFVPAERDAMYRIVKIHS